MPTTPNLALELPTVGANRDTWGTLLNDNFTTLDEFVSMAMPVGVVADFAGPNPPPGWLACDGRQVSRTTYSQLFAAIGVAWGNGDGSTTFNLPPANGRAAVGAGSVTDVNGTVRAYSFAQRAGALSYTILQANLPNITLNASSVAAHSHGGATAASVPLGAGTDLRGDHSHGGIAAAAGGHGHTASADVQGDHSHTVALPNSGAGVAAGAFSAMSSMFGSGSYGTSVNGAHTHTITVAGVGDHVHGITTDGGHAHLLTVPAHTHNIAADGGHTHTVPLGGSATAFDVVQPVMVVTKIIYAGQQAAPAAATAAVPLVRRLMSAPLRGSH